MARLVFPQALGKAAAGSGFRATLPERLGRGGWKQFLDLRRDTGPLLWFHAASLGEIEGVVPVLRGVRQHHPDIAVLVTAMHFLIIVGFMPLARRLTARLSGSVRLHVTYEDGRGTGTVGVIGPTRMRYSRAIAVVDGAAQAVSRVLRDPN